jgi:protein gp37
MALSPQHTFQVLTKRAERMLKWFAPYDARRSDSLGRNVLELGYSGPLESLPWPLPNVWLGVSTERQQEADERIPELLQTPAAVRFISYEPALGPLDIRALMLRHGMLDWVICGGESGKDARPMHPDWARSLHDQCAAAGVAFFFKQWGEHVPVGSIDRGLATDPNEFGWKRVGKKAAGRHLDGVLHDAMPQADGRGRG